MIYIQVINMIVNNMNKNFIIVFLSLLLIAIPSCAKNVELTDEHPAISNNDPSSSSVATNVSNNNTLDLYLTNESIYQGIISEYNTSSLKEEITVNNIPFENYDMELLAHLNDSDLFEIVSVWDYNDYIKNDMMLDLTDYIDSSDTINRDDYMYGVIDSLTVDGNIYAIPKSFGITTLLVPETSLSGKTSWNVSDYLEFIKKYPNALSVDGNTKADIQTRMVYYATFYSDGEFIDMSENKADYIGPEFKNFLQTIKELDITISSQSTEDRLSNGDVVILKADLSDPLSLTDLECKTGTELYPIGFPSANDEHSCAIIDYADMFAISSNSNNPDEAWQFIEYFLNNSFILPDYAPTNSKTYSSIIENSLEREEFVRDNILYTPSTQKQVDKLELAISTAHPVGGKQYTVRSIIVEEVQPYFMEQKTLDEVCEVIQSRIQLMLDEGNMVY